VFEETNGCIRIPLGFEPAGSMFIVFKKGNAKASDRIVSIRRDGQELVKMSETDANSAAGAVSQVPPLDLVSQEISQNGTYEIKTADGKSRRVAVTDLPVPLAIKGPWELKFAPGWGAPEKIVLDDLVSWSEHGDNGVKYFSGSATYRKLFDLPAEVRSQKSEVSKDNSGLRPLISDLSSRVYLDLGKVAVMAEVKLNGKNLGILWKPPYRVDITDSLKAGENVLEIRVVNLPVNRMIGDEFLPEDSERNKNGTLRKWPQWLEEGKPSPTGRFTFTTWRLWKKDEPLQESGLLGPVTMRTVMLPRMIAADQPASAAGRSKDPGLQLMGNRFFTFSTVVRVRQIETSRDEADGPDESSIHTPEEARTFREAVEKGWPGARITWAFSWLALKDRRPNYQNLKKLVVSYHEQYGDEITFIPGGYFANMYSTREQVNRDLHDGLQMVSEMVGGGYRPQSVIAGFLSAENLRFLAEEEGIHVCQGNIWSQYAVDNGDGEGSISYPYYPSREHFCKPAQGKEDFIDCVNLDGWTVDFLCARYPRARMINGIRCGSRQGVGPIETVLRMGTEQGTQAMLATTAAHFDKGFELNDFAWVTCIWELCLVEGRKIYGYNGRNGLDGLVIWLSEMRRRWPEAKCITHGEFGMLWRKQFRNNDQLNYRFVQRGSGIGGSDPDMEIRWFMNKDFRLALLRNWQDNTSEELIDFTRYDLKAREPADPRPGQHTRNWSLLNRLNQKEVRPQDKPIPIGQLNADEQAVIKRRYPELIKDNPEK
jgi:hypothetical protein